MKRLLLLALLLSLSACATGSQPRLPYRAWYVGLLAPDYMEVWVESVDVVDRRGLVFERVHAGVVSILTPPDNSGEPHGWPQRVGAGSGKNLPGIDLPEIVFVRWQSLVEPQTYNVRINIPTWVREAMVKEEKGYCHWQRKWQMDYRNIITIGLAPGGIAKVWLQGPCLELLEVGRFEGAVSKLGPSQGRTDGRYALPLTPESRSYVETHGVPYGSW